MQRSGLNFAKLLAEPEKEEQPEQPLKRQRLTSEMSTNVSKYQISNSREF